jgi:GNAT superfamily N-acetyltransferase
LTFRAATAADASAIAALSQELGYPADATTMATRLRQILGQPSQLVLVAQTAAGDICGWLQALSSNVLESGFRVEIVGLVVSANTRRQGVGKALVAAAETWARQVGAPSVNVRSNIIRIESHLFYPALGYLPVKQQMVYRKTLEPAD